HMVSLLMPPMASPLARSQEEIKDTLGDADPASHVLAHAAARELVSSGGVREECWVIKPLSERMAQELQDPVALATQQLPGWCDQLLRYGPFLLQFRVRKEYFHLSSFGLGRAVHRLLQQQRQGMDGQGGGGGGGGEGGGTGRHASHGHSHQGSHHHHHHHQYRRAPTSAVQQLKVQVSRRKLLASAEKVLEEHGSRRVLLETEFFNEPGTGSGPTAEFFSLVSKEMRSPNLGLWRGESHHDGLYPQPWSDPTGGSEERMKDQKGGGGRPEGGRGQKLRQFACLGRLIGQALLDERLLDIRFAAPLVATLAGRQASQSLPAALEEMERVDSALARQLQALAASTGLAQWFEAPESGQRSERQEQEVGPGKIVRESADADERVSALCLTFCLPGEPEIGLLGPSGVPVKPGVEGLRSDGGLGEDVTRQNLGLYVQRVLQVGLREAVRPQVTAMLTGLQDIVPTGALWVFTEEEIMAMVGGVGSEMGKDPEEILEALACDHGYTRGSQAVRWLVEILAEMTLEEERHFLMFVTGSPGLPVGGLMGCCPRLTVVKKVAEGHARALGQAGVDAMLPSASTCTNYLKLPDYSSRAVMRERLLLSLRHGQHSFHLS
ncbi:ubiquitin-protein ligase, partial [Nannochloropsis gaditana]